MAAIPVSKVGPNVRAVILSLVLLTWVSQAMAQTQIGGTSDYWKGVGTGTLNDVNAYRLGKIGIGYDQASGSLVQQLNVVSNTGLTSSTGIRLELNSGPSTSALLWDILNDAGDLTIGNGNAIAGLRLRNDGYLEVGYTFKANEDATFEKSLTVNGNVSLNEGGSSFGHFFMGQGFTSQNVNYINVGSNKPSLVLSDKNFVVDNLGIYETEFRISSPSVIDSKFITEPAFSFSNIWPNDPEFAALQISYGGNSTEITQEKNGGGPNDVNQIKLHTNTRDNTTRLPLVLNEAKEVAGPVIVPDMLTVGKDLIADGGVIVKKVFKFDDLSNAAEGSFLRLGSGGLAQWENPSNLGYDQGVPNHVATFDQNGKLKASAFSITQELATLELGIQNPNDNYLKHTVNGKDFEELRTLAGPKTDFKNTVKYGNNEYVHFLDFTSKVLTTRFNATNLSSIYYEPQLNWSGKVAEFNGSINSDAIIFEKTMEKRHETTGQLLGSRLDLWKISSGNSRETLTFDFNTSEEFGGRVNKTVLSLQYDDDSQRNIGLKSTQNIQTPNLYVSDWGLVPEFHGSHSLSLVEANSGTLLTLPPALHKLFNPVDFFTGRPDNVVAEFHGKVVADNFSKPDPSSTTGTTAIGNLLIEDFDYHVGPCAGGSPTGAEIATPSKTLFAREKLNVTNERDLYRLVLGKNIPKIGTGWVSCIDLNNSFDANPTVKSLGNLTTLESNYLLSVDGLAVFKSLLVMNPQAYRPWPDFVFEPGYKLATLDTVEAYIKKEKHLPGIPSAKEIDTKGIDVAQMASANTQKIEELFLYVIELKKQNDQLRAELQTLKSALK